MHFQYKIFLQCMYSECEIHFIHSKCNDFNQLEQQEDDDDD